MTAMIPTSDGGTRKPHAIALFSGGLDSALAVLLMLREGVEITALTFMTSFGCDLSDRSSCGHNPFPAAERFGFRVKLMNLGGDYLDMVRKPRYGYGKNMNPCVDCRIMMLRQARDYMEMAGADFVVTGEVMGQRPFSQVKDKLKLTEGEAGLKDRLLRPLSAQLLPPTLPEREGWVNRERLCDFRGRTRKPQMALAKELGLEDYPTPASGCLLTDPEYSVRLRDLFSYQEFVDVSDLNLLRTGRQFRLSDAAKAIVGRNQEDNARILANVKTTDIVLEVRGAGSPITVVRGVAGEDAIETAAKLTARYSALRAESDVPVTATQGGVEREIQVAPAEASLCERLRIAMPAAPAAWVHAPE